MIHSTKLSFPTCTNSVHSPLQSVLKHITKLKTRISDHPFNPTWQMVNVMSWLDCWQLTCHATFATAPTSPWPRLHNNARQKKCLNEYAFLLFLFFNKENRQLLSESWGKKSFTPMVLCIQKCPLQILVLAALLGTHIQTRKMLHGSPSQDLNFAFF